MAQAITKSPSLAASRATPFPSPPGLEEPFSETTAKDEVKAAALKACFENLEEKLQNCQAGNGQSRQALIEAIRTAVLSDVEVKVQEKADELWQKGKQMLQVIQQKHKERTQKLAEEVTKCNEKQRSLQEENEKLKQALTSLAARFYQVGAVFGDVKGAPGSPAPDAGGTTEGSTMSPPIEGSSSADAYTPGFSPGNDPFPAGANEGMDSTGGVGRLPEVPAFPFPTSSPSTAAPLSLAEALGTPQAPATQKTPLSLVNSLSTSPEVGAFQGAPQPVTVFSFTLRKADGADLGLNVSHHEHDRVLRVEGVRPEGAVEAWNRQCAGSASAEKAVMPGDKIISVNNIMYDPTGMLEECRDRQLLRLTIHRGDRPATAPAPAAESPALKASPVKSTTTLRADANVFVPMGATSSPTPTQQDRPEDSKEEPEAKAAAGAEDAAPQPERDPETVPERC